MAIEVISPVSPRLGAGPHTVCSRGPVPMQTARTQLPLVQEYAEYRIAEALAAEESIAVAAPLRPALVAL